MSFKCKQCGFEEDANYSPDVRSRLLAREVCFECDFWAKRVQMRKDNDPNALVIDGRHYHILTDDPRIPKEMRGFGGRMFRIKLLPSGREITTSNLWSQGQIPDLFRPDLPDNAEFLPAAT